MRGVQEGGGRLAGEVEGQAVDGVWDSPFLPQLQQVALLQR